LLAVNTDAVAAAQGGLYDVTIGNNDDCGEFVDIDDRHCPTSLCQKPLVAIFDVSIHVQVMATSGRGRHVIRRMRQLRFQQRLGGMQ
jgi:hypothetical protein